MISPKEKAKELRELYSLETTLSIIHEIRNMYKLDLGSLTGDHWQDIECYWHLVESEINK